MKTESITLWQLAQRYYRKYDRGILVFKPGVIHYLQPTSLGQATNETPAIPPIVNEYNPKTSFILATPKPENDDLFETRIISEQEIDGQCMVVIPLEETPNSPNELIARQVTDLGE